MSRIDSQMHSDQRDLNDWLVSCCFTSEIYPVIIFCRNKVHNCQCSIHAVTSICHFWSIDRSFRAALLTGLTLSDMKVQKMRSDSRLNNENKSEIRNIV